jgi:hypothetical protein
MPSHYSSPPQLGSSVATTDPGVARHRRYPFFEFFKEEDEEVTHQPITLLDLFKFLPSEDGNVGESSCE